MILMITWIRSLTDNMKKDSYEKLQNAVSGIGYGLAMSICVWIISGFLYPQQEHVIEEPVVSEDAALPEKTVSLSRISLDKDYEIALIGGIAYIVYDAGYGAGEHSSVTVMLDENGNPVTEEKLKDMMQ